MLESSFRSSEATLAEGIVTGPAVNRRIGKLTKGEEKRHWYVFGHTFSGSLDHPSSSAYFALTVVIIQGIRKSSSCKGDVGKCIQIA